MKRVLAVLASCFLLMSCENTWDDEARRLFVQGCMESAKESGMKETAAKSMCDCRLEKTMQKYPNFAEAMQNLNKVMDDEEVRACK